MDGNPNIAHVAALIADPSRARMLMTLLGGQTLMASELARIAAITPQTASWHLTKMVDGGLLHSVYRGRNRYFYLGSPEVAHVLETLSLVAKPTQVRSLRQSDEVRALRFARTCYDHLAGEVGVAVTSRLLSLGWLVPNGRDFAVTEDGASEFRKWFGMELDGIRLSRRVFARQCLDWSERRHHVAGVLGAIMTTRFFELGWIRRKPGTRAVIVTEAGAAGLLETLGLPIHELTSHGHRPPSNG